MCACVCMFMCVLELEKWLAVDSSCCSLRGPKFGLKHTTHWVMFFSMAYNSASKEPCTRTYVAHTHTHIHLNKKQFF